MRRRIWCETVPLAEVRTERTLTLLRRYRIDPIVSIRPSETAEATEVARACRDAGLRVALWPQLADEDGRWASDANAAITCDFVDRLVDATPGLTDVVIDFEPPFASVREATSGIAGAARVASARVVAAVRERARFADAGARYRALAEALRDRGVALTAVVLPLVAMDAAKMPLWQRLLGTPSDGLGASAINVMMYTTLFEGYSRGLVGRRASVTMLGALSRLSRARFGAGVGVSIGAVGTGALGDEATYRSPRELAEDVGVVRARGIDDIALFELGGVLRRPPAEAWLEAFTVRA